jgi:L,D-peptidoglycan transpeptidase YkuD (ErfK/YbiS/YcfS/YnhG family)
MILYVKGSSQGSEGTAILGNTQYSVVLGRSGVVAESAKREGDGCTPLGLYKVLYGLYRPDRVTLKDAEKTHLSWLPIGPDLGWCDAPTDPAYNSIVPVGYAASHEVLWREDSAYDKVLVIDHNMPARPYMGSAVFVHHLHPGKVATAGCIALAPADMDAVLAAGIKAIEISSL